MRKLLLSSFLLLLAITIYAQQQPYHFSVTVDTAWAADTLFNIWNPQKSNGIITVDQQKGTLTILNLDTKESQIYNAYNFRAGMFGDILFDIEDKNKNAQSPTFCTAAWSPSKYIFYFYPCDKSKHLLCLDGIEYKKLPTAK